MPKGLFLCAVTRTKRHFENKKTQYAQQRANYVAVPPFFNGKPSSMPLTEPPVRRYFRKLRRFSPSTEQTTFFAHRYGIFTAVRSLKPTLTKNLLSAVFLIASVPHCRRFWQVFCACFCAFCRATTKGGGKLTTFFKSPHCQCCKCNLPLCQRHTQQSFRIFSTISLT